MKNGMLQVVNPGDWIASHFIYPEKNVPKRELRTERASFWTTINRETTITGFQVDTTTSAANSNAWATKL